MKRTLNDRELERIQGGINGDWNSDEVSGRMHLGDISGNSLSGNSLSGNAFAGSDDEVFD